MSLKRKKMRKIARNAAMSALIVSAIVGTGVMASAADNNTIVGTGQVLTVVDGSAVTTATSLTVNNGGTVYVGTKTANSNKGYLLSGNANIAGGKLFVGQSDATTVVKNAIMTADNVTITNGGHVSVSNSSTLDATKNIFITNGTLELSGETGNTATGSTAKAGESIYVGANGTVKATQGLQNQLLHGTTNTAGTRVDAVYLNGGIIEVASGAGLTIAASGTNKADAGAKELLVASSGRLISTGGTIKAHLNSKGTTNFTGGTTTVDNLTVSDGTTTISGNALVKTGDNAEISGGKLEMQGGTLRVDEGKGTLKVTGGELLSSKNVNTVDGSINQSGGTITVNGGSTLNITKNLDVSATGKVTVKGGSTMSVAGTTKLAANSVAVGVNTLGTGILSITKGSLFKTDTSNKYAQNTDIATSAITLNTTAGAEGVLILTGWSGEVDLDTQFASGYLDGVTNAALGKTLTGNNIILMGATIKGVEAKLDNGANSGFVAYGSAVTVNAATGAKFTNTGTIIVPKLVAGSGVTEYDNSTGKTTLVGTGATDSNTTFTKYNQSGAGTTTVTGGAGLKAGTLAMADGSVNIEAKSKLAATTVEMTSGQLNVLNSTANLGTLKFTGGSIFVDPALVTIGAIDNNVMAGQLFDSAGSIVTIGADQRWLAKPMADAGFTFGNVNQATLGIAAKDTIDIVSTGVIAVDPSLKKETDAVTYTSGYSFKKADGTVVDATRANLGAFYAGAGSLTVLDVSGLDKDEAVFNVVGAAPGAEKVNIVNGAKLHVANLTVNGVTIFENTTTGGSIKVENGLGADYVPGAVNAGWAGANLIQPDRMLTAAMGANGKLTAKTNSASVVFGMSSEFEGLMQGVWGTALNNTNSPNAGIRFVSRAASTDYGLSANQVAKTIEGAAQLGAVAGVQGVTISAANSATSAVTTRTSFAQPLLDKNKAVAMSMDSEGNVSMDAGLSAGNGMKNGVALWIMPLYQSNNVWGQKAGNFKSGYNSDLGGIAAGVDYTINDMFRFGAALNIGGGYSQSNGDFASTDNSFNFWGVNLYGGWTMNNFGLSADVGYTGNYNKVEQDAPGALGMSNFKSDINSSAWTAGLKAEYKIETSVLDIIPHIGVRYMGLTTEQYDVKSGGNVFDVEQDFQSIWTFPIGVAFSKNFETGSGWVFKPQLDLSVIPAAGDVEAKSKSRIPGAPGSAEAKMQVVDYVTFDGGVGFDFGNENLNFGLNYNIQASEHRTGHGVFGTIRYEF